MKLTQDSTRVAYQTPDEGESLFEMQDREFEDPEDTLNTPQEDLTFTNELGQETPISEMGEEFTEEQKAQMPPDLWEQGHFDDQGPAEGYMSPEEERREWF